MMAPASVSTVPYQGCMPGMAAPATTTLPSSRLRVPDFRMASADDFQYALDLFLGRERGGVDHLAPGRHRKRRHRTLAVAPVTALEVVSHHRELGGHAASGELTLATLRALFERSIEIQLHDGVRKRHGPHVAPFGHDRAACRDAPGDR